MNKFKYTDLIKNYMGDEEKKDKIERTERLLSKSKEISEEEKHWWS